MESSVRIPHSIKKLGYRLGTPHSRKILTIQQGKPCYVTLAQSKRNVTQVAEVYLAEAGKYSQASAV